MLATGRMPEYSDAVTLAQRAAAAVAVAAEAPVSPEKSLSTAEQPLQSGAPAANAPPARPSRRRCLRRTLRTPWCRPTALSMRRRTVVQAADEPTPARSNVLRERTACQRTSVGNSEPPTAVAASERPQDAAQRGCGPVACQWPSGRTRTVPQFDRAGGRPAVTSEAHPAGPSDADVVASSATDGGPSCGIGLRKQPRRPTRPYELRLPRSSRRSLISPFSILTAAPPEPADASTTGRSDAIASLEPRASRNVAPDVTRMDDAFGEALPDAKARQNQPGTRGRRRDKPVAIASIKASPRPPVTAPQLRVTASFAIPARRRRPR